MLKFKFVKKRPYTFYALVLSLSFFSEISVANMTVYPMELNVDSSGTAQITVASKSDDIQFIRVKQKKILNPGTAQEKEIDVPAWQEGGIVVTPEKFALSAGAMRVVRLVSLVPPSKESTWRIYFQGVNQPDSITLKEQGHSAALAKIGVNVIWGALVHIAPAENHISLALDRTHGSLINKGTLRVPLKEIGICDEKDKCRWLKEEATIYPETERKLKTFSQSQGITYKFRYFNWINKTTEEAELPVVE